MEFNMKDIFRLLTTILTMAAVMGLSLATLYFGYPGKNKDIEHYSYENNILTYQIEKDSGVYSYTMILPKNIVLNKDDKLSFSATKPTLFTNKDVIELFVNGDKIYGQNDHLELTMTYKSKDNTKSFEEKFKS